MMSICLIALKHVWRWTSLWEWCMKYYAFFIVLFEGFQASCYSGILIKNLWQKPQERKTTLCGKTEMKQTFDIKITVEFTKWPFNSSRIHVCTIQYLFRLKNAFFLKHRPPIKVNWTHWFTHVWSWKVTYLLLLKHEWQGVDVGMSSNYNV